MGSCKQVLDVSVNTGNVALERKRSYNTVVPMTIIKRFSAAFAFK